jgi:hypothetical protein
MKPKFLLTIVAINTLFLGASIATASNIKPEYNITKLSQNISKLVGFNSQDRPLVATAIERAVTAKQIALSEDKKKEKNLPHPEPEIMGKVAVPKEIQQPPQTPRKKANKKIDR